MQKLNCFLLFLSVLLPSLAKIKVNTTTRQMVDEYGRIRFYHGVNAIYKVFPFLPITTHFDKDDSLSDEDFSNLKNWGLTFIRLYMPWEGVEPIRGQYNYTLLNEIQKIVQRAQKYNITILLDAHQDLLSKKFCGEGIPEWAVLSNTSFPKPVRSEISRDELGYPIIEDCLNITFAKYYFSYDLGQTFEDLYTNKENLADSFAAFWRQVASQFKNEPNVIGYEILNEPFFANLYGNLKEVIDFGYGDYHFLQPFYRKVHDLVREVDNETLLFFENIVMAMTVGFTEGPGGVEYNDRQLYSYHVYCGFTPTDLFMKYICQGIDWFQFNGKLSKAKDLGFATFLTEFGALFSSDREIDEIAHVAQKAENNWQSWAYWQFKNFHDITTSSLGSQEGFYHENGTLQEGKVKALAVTYMYALCGEPVTNNFDRGTGNYKVEFVPKACGNGKNSEIYISEDYYYKGGFSFRFDGCGQENCYLRNLEERFYYEVVVPEGVTGKVSLEITPK